MYYNKIQVKKNPNSFIDHYWNRVTNRHLRITAKILVKIQHIISPFLRLTQSSPYSLCCTVIYIEDDERSRRDRHCWHLLIIFYVSNKMPRFSEEFSHVIFPTTLYIVVAQLLSCVWLCDPTDYSTRVSSVLHYLPEFAQTHVHWVSDTIQPSQPLSPPYSPFMADSIFIISFCKDWNYDSERSSTDQSSDIYFLEPDIKSFLFYV